MEDINGLEIREGCVLRFLKVPFCYRVNFIKEGNCICDCGCTNKIAALDRWMDRHIWTQRELTDAGVCVYTYEPLGIYDIDAIEIHDQDEVEIANCSTKYKVFDCIKARNGDVSSYVLVENTQCVAGWRAVKTSMISLYSRPTNKKDEDKKGV